MQNFNTTNTTMVFLGRQGEHLARDIEFDVLQQWRQEYGDGEIRLYNVRPGETMPYAVALITAGEKAIWTVTATDTARSGTGMCELRYLVGEAVVKSQVYVTVVAKAISGSEIDPPETEQTWVQKVLDAGQSAQEALAQMQELSVKLPVISRETATWWVWDTQMGAYADSGFNCVGATGPAPVRGVDYWTEADIAAIQSYVDEAIENGAW